MGVGFQKPQSHNTRGATFRAQGLILLRSDDWSRPARSVVGVLLGPLAGTLNCASLVVLPVLSNGLIERVIDVGGRHQGLNRKKNLRATKHNHDQSSFHNRQATVGQFTYSLDLEGGRPLVLEDVEADTTYRPDKKRVASTMKLITVFG